MYSDDKEELETLLVRFPELVNNRDIRKKLSLEIDFEKMISIIELRSRMRAKDRLLDVLNGYYLLSKYERLEKLDLTGWALQFYVRKSAFSVADIVRGHINKYDLDDEHAAMYRYMFAFKVFSLIMKPVADRSDHKGFFWEVSPKEKKGGFNVEPLTNIDAFVIHEHLEKEGISQKIYKVWNSVPDECEHDEVKKTERGLYDVKENLDPDWGMLVHARIDLSANDQQLEIDFKKFVEDMRVEFDVVPSRKKLITDAKMKSWIKHRVLQYLDLRLLDLYVNRKETLTLVDIAKIIFPVEENDVIDIDVIEKLRKSTKNYASEVMSKGFLDALFSQTNTNVAAI